MKGSHFARLFAKRPQRAKGESIAELRALCASGSLHAPHVVLSLAADHKM